MAGTHSLTHSYVLTHSFYLIVCEKFSLIIQEKDETDLRPVFTDEGTHSLTHSLTHTYSLTRLFH